MHVVAVIISETFGVKWLHLHAPVSTESDDVVAEDRVLVRVELSCGHLGSCRHSRGIRDPLEHENISTTDQV